MKWCVYATNTNVDSGDLYGYNEDVSLEVTAAGEFIQMMQM